MSLLVTALGGCSAITDFTGLAGTASVDQANDGAVTGDGAVLADSSGETADSGDASADAGNEGPADAAALDASFDSSFDGSLANHQIKTVFVIVMTKLTYGALQTTSSAPYLSGLGAQTARASAYATAPASLDNSEPHDVWLEAADSLGIVDDGDPSANHQSTTLHLTTALENAGVTWKAYEEDIGGTTCPLVDVGDYLVHHDPFVFFDDITNVNSVNAPRCIAHLRPFSELATDLKNGTVSQYNFITPNACHDMHDDCTFGDGGGDPVAQGDAWLSAAVPAILASNAYKNGGALFIVWDYPATGAAADLPLFVMSAVARKGMTSTTAYSHSSFVKTMAEIFGIAPFRGAAGAGANDLSDLFTAFP